MRFQQLGKAIHPVLETAEDLRQAVDLDEALWVATSAPVHAFRMDPVLLQHLDSDKDTRIKCGELQEAIRWVLDVLDQRDGLTEGTTDLRADALSYDHPDAGPIRNVFNSLAPEEEVLTLETLRNARTRLEQKPVSEAGVILPDAAETPEQRRDIEQVLSLVEGAEHPSGNKGLSKEVLTTFGENIARRLAWEQQTLETDDLGRSVILPLAEATPAAYRVFAAVRDPINHYFRLCDAMEMAPESSAACWPGVRADLDWQDADNVQQALRNAPLARPTKERILKIDRHINPAWRPDLHRFRQEVLIPLMDRTDDTLTGELWASVCERLKPYEIWQTQEPCPELSGLSRKELETWAEPEKLNALRELCDQPATSTLTLTEVRLAEKLSLFQGFLLSFANNFIAFPNLYQDDIRAAFEVGSLIMDGRKFHLAVRVPHRADYLKALSDSTMFIMIVELVHPGLKQTMEVAVPATSGQQGNLRVGKHGVFEHVDGTQWFATVVHIQDNPISFAEAVFEPFKRLGQAVTRKIESLTQAAEKKLETSGGDAVTQLKGTASPGAGGMLAGGGIAVAALGSSLAFITKIFSELKPLGVAQGLLAAILAVLIPGSIVAALRLSKRDLSVLLEGADWAVNSRMRLNAVQRKAFTQIPPHPKGSPIQRTLEWWLWRILWILVIVALFTHGVLLG
jgi:hypothetical protein